MPNDTQAMSNPDVREITGEELARLQAEWSRQAAASQQLPDVVASTTKGDDLAALERRPGESRSRLLLGGLGEPESKPRRKPGRPRIIASWFPAVTQTMADGTSLRTALAICGIRNLGASEIRALYRNVTFRAMYQQARQRFLLENFGKKPTLRAKLGRYV